jgi:hypothetical protein
MVVKNNPTVMRIFLLTNNPFSPILKLYTRSVKTAKNLPSVPNYLSHNEQRCLFVAVTCIMITIAIIMTALGTMLKRTNANIIEINYGFIII